MSQPYSLKHITVIGLGSDSTLAGDAFWARYTCHKVAEQSAPGIVYYASPAYHQSGKLASPTFFPTITIFRNGEMLREQTGKLASVAEFDSLISNAGKPEEFEF